MDVVVEMKGESRKIVYKRKAEQPVDNITFTILGSKLFEVYNETRTLSSLIPPGVPMVCFMTAVFDKEWQGVKPKGFTLTITIGDRTDKYFLTKETWLDIKVTPETVTIALRNLDWVKESAIPKNLIRWIYPDQDHKFLKPFNTHQFRIKMGNLEMQYDHANDLPLWCVDNATWEDVALFAAERIRLLGHGSYLGLGPVSDEERLVASLAADIK